MKNLRAICDAALGYYNYMPQVRPETILKLLDVIELQREALSGIVNHERALEVGYSDFGIAQNRLFDYSSIKSTAREALAKSESLLK